jgi:protein TonB
MLTIPVKAMDAGQLAMMGAVDGSLTAPPNSLGPGKNGGAGNGDGTGSGNDKGSGLRDGGPSGVSGPGGPGGGGATPPEPIRQVRPEYTPDAIRARIQGEVWVSAIVLPNGTVTDLHVVRSLDAVFGLDEQALKAVAQWRFKPGMRLGQPVAVPITVSVGFAVR